jgi:hypothetical protein
MAKIDYSSNEGNQIVKPNRVAIFAQLIWMIKSRYYICCVLSMLVAAPFTTVLAATATVSVTINCLGGPPCLITPSLVPQIVIIGTTKNITWTANYSGAPNEGKGFYITDVITKNKIALSTSLAQGMNSGNYWLSAGTYSINASDNSPNGMGSGTYTIEYNPGSTGEPHITTINGVHYDFQSAGEFTFLRQPKDMEIQVRQTPVATNGATCVSINSAVAARVGSHRVTYEPNLNGIPDPNGLQLRVDGKLVELGRQGIDLSHRGRVTKTEVAGGIRIDFYDGSYLLVTPGWWTSQKKWYLNLNFVPNSDDGIGIAGAIDPDNWLPKLPDGSSMGPLPQTPHDRYVAINQKFADAWRVTDKNSLFDYAPGTSTKTFTNRSWPSEFPPCDVEGITPAEPIAENIAKLLSQEIKGGEFANCVYDVMVTGNPGFATTYALSQSVVANARPRGSIEESIPSKFNSISIFVGLLLGLLISLLVFLVWRKKIKP